MAVKHLLQQFRDGGFKYLLLTSFEFAFIKLLRTAPLVYARVSPTYYRWRSASDIERYSCSPDPFKVVTVSPDRIQYRTGRDEPYFNRRGLFGAVKSGDWDKSDKAFDHSLIHRSMKQRFVEGLSWKETDIVKYRMRRIEQGDSYSLFKNKEEVFKWCENMEVLYDRIRSNGYQQQTDLLSDGEYNSGLFQSELDEITVDIGRDGELLFVDGRHRLSLAKILELDEIPVVFLVRHEKWMERREELCESDEPIPDHPDLRDLK